MDDEIEAFIKSNAGKGKNISLLYNERSHYGGQLHVVFNRLIDYKIVSIVGNKYIIQGTNFSKSIKDMESLEKQSGDQIINVKENKGQIFQSRDDQSFNKTEKTTNKPSSSPDNEQNTWTASNTSFVIITGFVAGILVLIFWEQIKYLFEK